MEDSKPIMISDDELADLISEVRQPRKHAGSIIVKREGGSGTGAGAHYYKTGDRFVKCMMLRSTYMGDKCVVGKVSFIIGKKYDMFMTLLPSPKLNAVVDLWILSGSKCVRIPYSEYGLKHTWPDAYEGYKEMIEWE